MLEVYKDDIAFKEEQTKSEEQRKTTKQNRQKVKKTERRNTRFKGISRKCKLMSTRIEQNNDHARIMHRIQFCSPFNNNKIFCFYALLLLFIVLKFKLYF